MATVIAEKLISHSRLLLLIIGIVLVSGCATMRPRDTDTSFEKIDPYEKVNRESYKVTDWLDRKISLTPVLPNSRRLTSNMAGRFVGQVKVFPELLHNELFYIMK